MSFHSNNYGLNPNPKQFKSWVGDSALLFVARLVLIEKYPFLPIKLLASRMNRVVENRALSAYCKRHNLPFGCNHLEIKIGELVLDNRIDEAKQIILDILNYDNSIKSMDIQQIQNGKLKENFKNELINKYKSRETLAEKHRQIDNLDLSFEDKKRLHEELKLK